MNKKIIISLGVIGLVATMAIGATMSYFSDTETSAGNIFVAGDLDLKVDHVKQTYNDVDCKTCGLVLISDGTNMVTERNGNPLTPYPAVYVGSNGGFIHPAWTAEEDPLLVAAGAKWIWESDPTQLADTQTDTTYTFEKKFQWFGPITSSDFEMAVGHDNTVEVWLNGVNIANGTDPNGYEIAHMLHISGATITDNIVQGNNVLKFIVKNLAWPGGPYANPAGLIYKFAVGGSCGDDYFKTHCTLFGEKDLAQGDYFWQFDDVKPGDRGTNVISLHAYSNDAYACLITNHIDDQENAITDPETADGDSATVGMPSGFGDLSPFISAFAWNDDNGNGIYESGETAISGPASLSATLGTISLTASSTKYIGLAWCAGTQGVVGNAISCDGSTMNNIAQTDSFTANMNAYAIQKRNNPDFNCANVTLP